jgi:hypothetical protein
MKSMPTTDLRREIQDALCAAVQLAQDLQAHYSLASILADSSDQPYEDFLYAVDLIAGLYFTSQGEAAGAIERNVRQLARDGSSGPHVARHDAVARAALVLGLGWALVDRRGPAQAWPVH